MFTTIIVRPIFNLLTIIYAMIPGHNFGLSIILFTILVRLLMWPLLKKQLHHAKAMRELQPELKRIKKAAAGDRQKESVMVMELYKERQINPAGTLGLIIIQIPIFIGLYAGINRIVHDPQEIVKFSYPFVRDLGWLKAVAADIGKFDNTLFGIVDLTRPALNKGGGVYVPAAIIVVLSAAVQFLQSRQLMPKDPDARGLRQILKDASTGKQTEQSEVNAAVGRGTQFFIPIMILLITVNVPSALSLYWLTSGIVAVLQQKRILDQDETELEAIADKPMSKSKSNVKVRHYVESKVSPKTHRRR